jgi:phosphonate transport system substrate-binding protein
MPPEPTRRALLGAIAAACLAAPAGAQSLRDGSQRQPFRVVLVPADGGTEDGTRADFAPLFAAITQQTGLHFELRVGQSYGAVVEAMCSGVAEIAWFGPVSFLQAAGRGCAELLAVDVLGGESVYYSGIFVRADFRSENLTDLRGRAMAFGDVNSTSSFAYPVAMLLRAGLDPARDLGRVRITGSHANSLAALRDGLVDAAAAAFDSYERAVRAGALDGSRFRVLARSEAIPNPPLALHPALPAAIKDRLRAALDGVHRAPGVMPAQIRGYGGKQVDRYDASISLADLRPALETMALVDHRVREAMIRRAAER